jgi:hypothetical protein
MRLAFSFVIILLTGCSVAPIASTTPVTGYAHVVAEPKQRPDRPSAYLTSVAYAGGYPSVRFDRPYEKTEWFVRPGSVKLTYNCDGLIVEVPLQVEYVFRSSAQYSISCAGGIPPLIVRRVPN